MDTRPNPTQHVMGDEREWREYLRLRVPDGFALDKQDLALAFEASSQRSIFVAVKRAALDWVLQNMPDRFIVRRGFVEELHAYVEGTGDFPVDAKAVSGDEQVARRLAAAMNPGDRVSVGRGVYVAPGTREEVLAADEQRRQAELKPDAEGRYPGQEPRGRFARAGDPGSTPDPR